VKTGNAPHYCEIDHAPIRHWDSESEMCPLCVAEAEIERLRKLIVEADKALTDQMQATCDGIIRREAASIRKAGGA
jgi:hypothetical protein